MSIINGDLIPASSGFANLGVDVSSNGPNAFDITSIAPFGQIHMLSGVFHDPLLGQSGILRYSREQAAFQVSVNGGLTFVNLTAGAVDSVGVIGDTNLTGHVDFATRASGFMVIEDSSDASPLLWAVDNLGLSGLWRFPTQGFNGRVVNALTDFNGTEAQGVINVVGASGVVVDIIGQTLTITPGNTIPRTYTETFSLSTTWTVNHNLNTVQLIVQVWNAPGAPAAVITPDQIRVTTANTVTVTFNTNQSGRVVIMAC